MSSPGDGMSHVWGMSLEVPRGQFFFSMHEQA